MRYTQTKHILGFVLMLSLFSVALGAGPAARAREDNRAPDLPSPICDIIQVPAGNKVSFHVYAVGVQVYRWNGASWAFVEPVATLYADANYHGKVGTHYFGPTWESNNGTKVFARRLQGCPADPSAIDWLLLEVTSTEGEKGNFDSTTYIHRVNTVGGRAPVAPGTSIGATVEVPYTAEYYFYRAEN